VGRPNAMWRLGSTTPTHSTTPSDAWVLAKGLIVFGSLTQHGTWANPSATWRMGEPDLT